MRMRDIENVAKKRRADLLAQFGRMPKGATITEFAEKHGMTRARMSQLLLKAKMEREKA